MQADKNTASRNDVNKVIALVSTQNDPQLHNTAEHTAQTKGSYCVHSVKWLKLLVDTGAGISVIDEQFLT